MSPRAHRHRFDRTDVVVAVVVFALVVFTGSYPDPVHGQATMLQGGFDLVTRNITFTNARPDWASVAMAWHHTGKQQPDHVDVSMQFKDVDFTGFVSYAICFFEF